VIPLERGDWKAEPGDGFEQLRVLTEVPLPMTWCDDGEPAAVATFGPGMEQEHLAVIFGSPTSQETPLVRVHSECLTGDVFSSARCDCGPQLEESLRILNARGGILLYLRQEGRGIGLYHKVQAYALQDEGMDTYEANQALGLPADARDFHDAARMLHALGIHRCRLITNNPDKVRQLTANGIKVVECVRTGVFVNANNYRYLAAKKHRAQHVIEARMLAQIGRLRQPQHAQRCVLVGVLQA